MKLDNLEHDPKAFVGGEVTIGQKHFKWTVIDQPKPGQNVFTMQCQCGVIRQMHKSTIVGLHSTQCMRCRRAELKKNRSRFFGD